MSRPQGFRIVHATAQLRLGAGRYVVDTAIAQHRRDPGRVAVVVSHDAGAQWVSSPSLLAELERAGVPVIRAGSFFHRETDALEAAARGMRAALVGTGAWTSDAVVHAHTAMAAAVARWAGAPRVVLTCHGWSPDRPAAMDFQDALAYSLCDRVTSPSQYWAAQVQERTAVADVTVLPYGLNLSRMTRATADPASVPRLVCVGELTHRKGQDVLLAAMPAVWAVLPDVELHLLGDGDLAPALRAQARLIDPSGRRVVFHGMAADPWALTNPSDVFVLPTRSDNQPLALIEAMAAGLPVVVTRIGGIPELVEDARCGLIVESENAHDLAVALRVLLETSAAGRRELGARGPDYVRAHFDVERHVGALDELYELSSPAPGAAPKTVDAHQSLVRLYVGCNTDKRAGWVNIDSRGEVSPDIVARAHRLTMFADASVDVIEACHLLEHLPLHEARTALAEWARVLRSGGELLLELPDFDTCVQLLGRAQDPQGYDIGMMGIFGWPPGVEKNGDDWCHHWGWSRQSLQQALEANGFGEVQTLPVTQTWRPATKLGRDFRSRAIRQRGVVEAAA